MPVYQVSYQHGRLTEDQKAKVAAAITDAHVETTGAPRIFVHTFFNELPPGISFSADGPDTTISGITGQIRAGRSLQDRQKLIKRIVASWVEITGQPAKQLIAGLTEIVSETQMEYGLILPRPGDEPAWFAENADALDGISGTGL